MRNWLIYEPPGGALRSLDDAEKFVTVREGFSKVAFFFAPVWLIAKRCWVGLAVWAAAVVAVVLLAKIAGAEGGGAFALLILPNLGVGFENAWIRARSLERRGYTLAGSAMARSREEAEVNFFQEWLDGRPTEAGSTTAIGHAPYRPATTGVLGLFPQPGSAR